MPERLQKYLAARGLGSRREIEAWISRGEIQINNRVAQLGDQVSDTDVIRVRGRVLGQAQRPHQWLVYHKPEGEICTRQDPEGRPSVFASLPRLRGQRWVSVGRLDLNTSGLMLFTTDGALAHALMHPSNELVREYAVRVLGEVSESTQARLLAGLLLDDGEARFASLAPAGGEGANHWFHVTVTEGRNRLVRRLWEAAGCTVSRLIRVRFGPIVLGHGLKSGRHRPLESTEVTALYAAVGSAPTSNSKNKNGRGRFDPAGKKRGESEQRGQGRSGKRR